VLETLLKLLAVDAPAPEILLEEDGCLCLDWRTLSVSIWPNGHVSWASLEPSEHGTDIDELLKRIKSLPIDSRF